MFSFHKVSQLDSTEAGKMTAAERRRSQNRTAQKNYRQNIKNRLNRLEEINRSLIHDKIASGIPSSISGTERGVSTYHELHSPKATTYPAPHKLIANAPTTNFPELLEEFELDNMNQLLDISSLTDLNQNKPMNDFPTINSSYPTSQSPVLPQFATESKVNPHSDFPSSTANDFFFAKSSTALHLTVRKNHECTARILIDNGAAVGAIDEEGRTPLHVAAEMGSYDCVQLLINEGAQLDLLDHKDMSAVKLAAMNGLADVVILLLQHGANVNL